MSNTEDIALMAHLIRRAGFGSNPEQLGKLVEQGYEQTVEQLVNPPDDVPRADQYLIFRFMPALEGGGAPTWLYNMLNTQRHLEEKMALFWHHVFATGNSKVDNMQCLSPQLEMLRDNGLGNYRDLLVRIAQDPAMIFWLDNNENHKRAPNENWGRELLELFSMGVGNYTEKDVFECARAFTGWTIGAKIPRTPYHRYPWHYEFRAEEHDYGEKTFLGHTGNFDGEDIIDIILQQPACPRFVARHLYNFFVGDEPQVPAWNIEPPGNPEAIEQMAATFVDSGFEIKPVLREMFNSDFFKESMYQKVKSPTEVVVGTLLLTGDLQGPDPRLTEVGQEPGYMGQNLLNPPSVEGWQTGRDWINSGSVVSRINFVAERVGNIEMPGVQSIIARVASDGASTTPEALVDRCLDLMGPVQVSENTRRQLASHAEEEGAMLWATDKEYATSSRRVGDMLALIAAATEYQFG